MMGRSGRPKFDTSGEAVLAAKNEKEAEELWERYIAGEPEEIKSKLGIEPVLRMHTLALIASGIIDSEESLFDFFSKTFYSYQYGDISEIERILEKIIAMLERFGFIKTEKGQNRSSENPFVTADRISDDRMKIKPTHIGKRVSELYIDPLTAHQFILAIKSFRDKKPLPFPILQLVCNTIEMMPLLPVRKKELEKVEERISAEYDNFAKRPPDPYDLYYEDFIRSVRTAMLIDSWINEKGEDEILDEFNVTPGELRARLENSDWLIYALQELCIALKENGVLSEIKKVRLRMKYGVKEELLSLVQIKGIGRVRARMLYTSGVRKISDLKKMPFATLKRVLGERTAKNVIEQIGGNCEDEQNLTRFSAEKNDNKK